MKLFFKKGLILLVFIFASFFSAAQMEKKFSIGISTDYGFGKDFNNCASTLKLHYHLFEEFRISPSFSYYYNKENVKMNVFSFNFHYLFPDLIPQIFPVLKNQGLCFYPVVGFCVANISNPRKSCSDCSSISATSGANYMYHFGFDFGAGIDYDLPTLLPFLRDMSASFEVQYQAAEKYARPLLLFGIMYNF